jgi:DNA-binding MarR family transcriptional regulator
MSKTAIRAKRAPRLSEQASAEPADPVIDLGPLPTVVGYMLRRAQLAAFQDFLRSYAEVDVRPAQYAVLSVIEHNPGVRQSQISAALGIKRANLVALLDSLERRGLAKRTPVATDRRSYALNLTEAGATLMQKLAAINALHDKRVTAKIGASGRRELLRLLHGVVEAVGMPAAEEEDA